MNKPLVLKIVGAVIGAIVAITVIVVVVVVATARNDEITSKLYQLLGSSM